MANGPNYQLHLRRRREDRTNYKKRLALLKSGKDRAVIRISNKHAQVQMVRYQPDGDAVMAAGFSGQLEDYGWDHNTGNLPAAYLTGFLAGRRALDDGITEAIADLGVRNQPYGTRYYAALKGVQDAGIELDLGENALPALERLEGEHADAYESSGITDAVETVRNAITGAHGEA